MNYGKLEQTEYVVYLVEKAVQEMDNTMAPRNIKREKIWGDWFIWGSQWGSTLLVHAASV